RSRSHPRAAREYSSGTAGMRGLPHRGRRHPQENRAAGLRLSLAGRHRHGVDRGHAVGDGSVLQRPVRLLLWMLLLCSASAAEATPPWNVGYRTIALRDPLTGESFPVALWYPTSAATAPLFVTGALSLCRLPAILCRWIAYEMPVAQDAPVAAEDF